MTAAPRPLAARLAGLTSPADREARERLLLESLADFSPQVRTTAVALAARELEPERLVSLVAESADSVLRNAALAALERQGPYARSAVEQAVFAADQDLAMFACQVLGSIGGASSAPALLQALGRTEVNVVHAASEALGRLRRPEAIEPLLSLLQGEPWLQLAAADALGAIGDSKAAEGLLALLPDSMVADAALDALARIAAPAALPRLLELLSQPRSRNLWPGLLRAAGAALRRSDPPAEATAEALARFGRSVESDHGPASLWGFLAERLGGEQEDDRPTRPDDRAQARGTGPSLQATGALVLASGITSLLPLVLRWGELPPSRAWLAPLVQRHLAGLLPLIGSLLAHPDPAVRAGTLALVPADSVGAAALCRALEDPATGVRIAACQSLAEAPETAATMALTSLLDQGTPAERAGAAQALIRLPESAYLQVLGSRLAATRDETTLIAVLAALAEVDAPGLEETLLRIAVQVSGSLRRVALRAVARVPGSRSEALLLRALAEDDQGHQVEALDLLVTRGGDQVLTTLVALLGTGNSLRYHVIRALGRLGRSEATTPLIALYSEAPLHERIEILTTLSRLSGRDATPFLLGALQDRQPEIRRVAAQALGAHAGSGDQALLAQLANDEDWVVRAEAARALGRLGGAGRALLLELGRDLEPTVARTARAALAGR